MKSHGTSLSFLHLCDLNVSIQDQTVQVGFGALEPDPIEFELSDLVKISETLFFVVNCFIPASDLSVSESLAFVGSSVG